MKERSIRLVGLASAVCYAAFIVWMYQNQPQTFEQVTGGLAAGIGVYNIDQQSFDEGLELFRRDRFDASRAAFERADPAQRDARTQFYIAYSYYRSGWGRLYQDNEMFAQGLDRADRAIELAPDGRLVVDDAGLDIHTPEELKFELAAGLRTDPSDFNPMRVFRKRK